MIARVPDINILSVTVIHSTAIVLVIVVSTAIIIETVTITVTVTVSVIITVATVPSVPVPAPFPAAASVDEVTFKPVAFSKVAIPIPNAMLITIAMLIAISIAEIISGATFPVTDVRCIKPFLILILILIAGPIAAPLVLIMLYISTSIVAIHITAAIGPVHACVSLSATSTSAVSVAPTVGSILVTSTRW